MLSTHALPASLSDGRTPRQHGPPRHALDTNARKFVGCGVLIGSVAVRLSLACLCSCLRARWFSNEEGPLSLSRPLFSSRILAFRMVYCLGMVYQLFGVKHGIRPHALSLSLSLSLSALSLIIIIIIKHGTRTRALSLLSTRRSSHLVRCIVSETYTNDLVSSMVWRRLIATALI